MTADVGGLQPSTTYHVRIVAANAAGSTPGNDRTFTTRTPSPSRPPSFVIRAEGPVVHFPHAAVIRGTVRGVRGGTQVVLETRPFPYSAEFAAASPAQTLGAANTFRFSVPLAIGSDFRVSTVDPPATSQSVRVDLAPHITTNVNTLRPRRGRRVRFTGAVSPPAAGVPFAVQRQTAKGAWVTVAGGRTRRTAGGLAAYGKTIGVRRDGDYRVYVRMGDGVIPGAGITKRIRPR